MLFDHLIWKNDVICPSLTCSIIFMALMSLMASWQISEVSWVHLSVSPIRTTLLILLVLFFFFFFCKICFRSYSKSVQRKYHLIPWNVTKPPCVDVRNLQIAARLQEFSLISAIMSKRAVSSPHFPQIWNAVNFSESFAGRRQSVLAGAELCCRHQLWTDRSEISCWLKVAESDPPGWPSSQTQHAAQTHFLTELWKQTFTIMQMHYVCFL